MEKKAYRIIDANYNRLREGLRVCEDILRFSLPKPEVALALKKLRKKLARIIDKLDREKLLRARDTVSDNNKFKLLASQSKISYQDLLRRNFQRATEALRVLEEVSLLVDPDLRKSFTRLRFEIYRLEKKVVIR